MHYFYVVGISRCSIGKFSYANAFGVRSLEAGAPLAEKPLALDTIMWIASCTKLITTIAALQCVERGEITLDEDVRPVLHELQDLPIIERGEKGNAVIKCRNTTPITLRHLLTHTSGFAYDFSEPLLQQWLRQQPENERRPSTSVRNRYLNPLVYEPGKSAFLGAAALISKRAHIYSQAPAGPTAPLLTGPASLLNGSRPLV
jgi:CubicO group peptidase (beta-lactamase class C family)